MSEAKFKISKNIKDSKESKPDSPNTRTPKGNFKNDKNDKVDKYISFKNSLLTDVSINKNKDNKNNFILKNTSNKVSDLKLDYAPVINDNKFILPNISNRKEMQVGEVNKNLISYDNVIQSNLTKYKPKYTYQDYIDNKNTLSNSIHLGPNYNDFWSLQRNKVSRRQYFASEVKELNTQKMKYKNKYLEEYLILKERRINKETSSRGKSMLYSDIIRLRKG